MPRATRLLSTVIVGCCLASAAACTPKQAPLARTTGKVLSLGGVAGLIASSIGARFLGQGQELLIGFSVISGVGLVTYAAGELSQPEVVYKAEPIPQRNHRWAKILTERAAGAARDGRCARVRRLEPRVHRYDAAVHDLVFMKDPEILRCLEGAVPPSGLFDGAAPADAAPPPPPETELPQSR